jgi:hypothetical protein
MAHRALHGPGRSRARHRSGSLDQFDIPLAASRAIARWFASTGYDKDPVDEQRTRLTLLADFCRHVDQSPDDLVAYQLAGRPPPR